VQAIPPPRGGVPLQMQLSDYVGSGIIAQIQAARQVVFHCVGDTGAAKVAKNQTVATAIAHEAGVADAMAADLQTGAANPPAFFFHLGDVVYNFGEGIYYYDQFYEPFRAYDRPIFAIPGNHDGMVFGNTPDVPQTPTLQAFLRNFCATATGPSSDAGGLVRSVMNQPGVYFTLEAPFVSIIGLYSNVLDGPGVISSQNGHYPITDEQLTFLKSELTRLKPKRAAGTQSVMLAVHHPPLSADSKHGGSGGVSDDIDSACKAVGLWPDVVLSGHAHLYQRFTRNIPGGQQIPYVVCGAGGFAATAPQTALPPAPVTYGDHTLEVDPIVDFGYLTITASAAQVTVAFRSPTANGVRQMDSVTVDLASHTISSGASSNAPAGSPAKAKSKTPKASPKPSTPKRKANPPAKSKRVGRK